MYLNVGMKTMVLTGKNIRNYAILRIIGIVKSKERMIIMTTIEKIRELENKGYRKHHTAYARVMLVVKRTAIW